jgi:hypothetical protein
MSLLTAPEIVSCHEEYIKPPWTPLWVFPRHEAVKSKIYIEMIIFMIAKF